jgi:ketosteroid isomerase-like protein
MDEDLEAMSREQLIKEVQTLRNGIRHHRDSIEHELCWHHPELWGLLPEKSDPIPVVPDWPQFLRGCLKYRESLDTQLPNAARTKKEFDEQTVDNERMALLDQDSKWLASAAGNDVELMVSFWSDDAMVYSPGLPPIAGKNSIREYVRQSLSIPGFSIRWNTTKVEISKDGTLAYAIGTNETTFKDPNGKLITAQGKTVTVWRKDSSGVWKCVVDIWNDNPTR